MNAAVGAASGPARPRNRKAMILRAANQHFLREGYHGTSMTDIARTVGITATALYRHFRNKEELLTRTVLDGIDRSTAGLAGATDLDGIVALLAGTALDRRGQSTLWQRELRYLAPDARAVVVGRLTEVTEQVAAAVADARPELTEADAALLASGVLAVFESASQHRVSLPRQRFGPLLTTLAGRVAAVDLTAAALPEPPVDVGPVLDRAAGEASRRDRLLAAAARLFGTRGYRAVCIDDIADHVGITGPSVYYHFGRKSDLLCELFDRTSAAMDAHTARALAEAADPADALRLLLRYYLSFALGHRDLVSVTMSELPQLPADAAMQHRQRQRAAVQRWVSVLRAARPELDDAAARVVVHAVLMVINEVVRTTRLAARPHVHRELLTIGMAMQLSDI